MRQIPFKSLVALLFILLAGCKSTNTATQRHYLSGTSKDDAVQWDFLCSAGRNSGQWSKIAVPSNWEFQGFGQFTYGRDANGRPTEMPQVTGNYRHPFKTPDDFAGQHVFLVFEGSMTDTEAKINGQVVGPKHQGSFYRFKYDVTSLLKPHEENLLEVTVDGMSADRDVNGAERQGVDFWAFSGIYRPVYLEATPAEYIDRVAIDARADGSFSLHAFLGHIEKADTIEAQIMTLDGKPVGPVISEPVKADETVLKSQISKPKLWTSETPNLYQVEVTLKSGKTQVHSIQQRFGFRTMEVREGDGIYVNGTRILLKGICRHSFWPDSGRSLSPALNEADVRLIKEMNCNAVRMSHYPPDQDFLDKCDELGLYVLDELGGWHHAYNDTVGHKLVAEMVKRDVNHPSILFWDNGNEGGWNDHLNDDFAMWDPQQRHVLHPQQLFRGMNTAHYIGYSRLQQLAQGPDVFMPTEYLHGLFDGGLGSGLHDFWPVIRNSRFGGGAFFWVFADEGAKRDDKDGMVDVAGNLAPDGVLGPYHQKEGSFFTIKQLWSPVIIDKAADPFDGKLAIENRYHFTDLKDCKFTWTTVAYPKPGEKAEPRTLAHGTLAVPATPPGKTASVNLRTPTDMAADAITLTARDPFGAELWTWTFSLRPEGYYRKALTAGAGAVVQASDTSDAFSLTSGKTAIQIDKQTGLLKSASAGGKVFPLSAGPRPTTAPSTSATVAQKSEGNERSVEATYSDGELKSIRWTMIPGGWVKLDWTIEAKGPHNNLGISFNLPENEHRSITWLGNGPYRVWQNRLDGPTLGLWTNAYNETRTGENLWQYPEYRGYFSKIRWARITTSEGPITLVMDNPDLYLRLLSYPQPAPLYTRQVSVEFPPGDISILHAIPAIGTKSQDARGLGPSGAPFVANGPYSGTIWLRFGN